MNNLLPLPVLLPLFGAGIALALNRHPRAQRIVSTLVMVAVTTVAAILIGLTDRYGPVVLWVGSWPQPLGIALVADRLSALMLLVSAVVTLAVLLFSMGAPEEERKRETPVSIFHPTLLVLSAGVSNAFLAGDLFNLFVGFEMLLFASYVLLTLGGTGDRVRAGSTYVVVSLLVLDALPDRDRVRSTRRPARSIWLTSRCACRSYPPMSAWSCNCCC